VSGIGVDDPSGVVTADDVSVVLESEVTVGADDVSVAVWANIDASGIKLSARIRTPANALVIVLCGCINLAMVISPV
jgi:hypothetical protein